MKRCGSIIKRYRTHRCAINRHVESAGFFLYINDEEGLYLCLACADGLRLKNLRTRQTVPLQPADRNVLADDRKY